MVVGCGLHARLRWTSCLMKTSSKNHLSAMTFFHERLDLWKTGLAPFGCKYLDHFRIKGTGRPKPSRRSSTLRESTWNPALSKGKTAGTAPHLHLRTSESDQPQRRPRCPRRTLHIQRVRHRWREHMGTAAGPNLLQSISSLQ